MNHPNLGSSSSKSSTSSTATSTKLAFQPWVEKYRPKHLTQLYGNKNVIQRMQTMVDKQMLMHLICSGSSGIGKTSAIHCLLFDLFYASLFGGDSAELNDTSVTKLDNNEQLARVLQCKQILRAAVKELNASEDRGVDVIRNQVRDFAEKRNDCIPAHLPKVVILDEADGMTKAAQHALEETMQLYEATTRFILICNDLKKINSGLQSRCAPMHFQPVSQVDILQCIRERILSVECPDLVVEQEALEFLIDLHQGDMRATINDLQGIISMCFDCTSEDDRQKNTPAMTSSESKESSNVLSSGTTSKRLQLAQLKQYLTVPSETLSEHLIQSCLKRNFQESLSIVHRHQEQNGSDCVEEMLQLLHSGLTEFTSTMATLSTDRRQKWIECLAEARVRVLSGANSTLQLASLVSKLCTV
jgi:DNA polymerase III delta prime subunit